MSSTTSTCFLRLNNSETFVELVGARPLHLLSQTVLPLKSPTGAFIAPLRCANASLPMAGRAGSSCKQRKTGSSHWGTPCCTYRYHMWILAGCVLFRGAPCFLFCLIFPYSAVLFSLPTDCKRRRSPRTLRTQTTLFRCPWCG